MYKIFALLSILLQFALAHGTIFKGSLISGTSGLPVGSAAVSFRIGQLPYPTAISDANGTFFADLEVPNNYPMQIFIAADKYCAKKIEMTVNNDTMDAGTISLDELMQQQIRLIGTVIDSVTCLPVSGAKIEITKIKGSYTPYMSFFADNAGSFCREVVITNDYSFVCTILDSGYYPTSFDITKAEDSVQQTIHLRPEGSIRLTVNGQVIDAGTGLPVKNARVILGTNFHDAIPDTFFTGNDGIFIRSVAAGLTSSAVPALYCNISADGYTSYSDRTFVVGINSINLEEIALVSTSSQKDVKVMPQRFQASPASATVNTYVTLNGRLICNNSRIQGRNDCTSQILINVMQKKSPGKKVIERSNRLK
jgi:protocatechuate 3,4-dioxygenase beta subunit